jgi:hypothetical protein
MDHVAKGLVHEAPFEPLPALQSPMMGVLVLALMLVGGVWHRERKLRSPPIR